MRNWNDESLSTMIEQHAEENDFTSSEEELSEAFDEQIAPDIIENHGKKGEEFTDTTMMNEAFNDWTDALCKDGSIHPEQYNNYRYVGEYSA